MKLLLLESDAGVTEYALLKEGRLSDYGHVWAGEETLVESVYLGRVTRFLKSLSAVFVRLSPEMEGFLPLDGIPVGVRPRSGDELIVQIRKPPTQGKSPFLSRDITLVGRLAILLPVSRGIHVSARVADRQERDRLVRVARESVPEGMGLVMRAYAAGKDGEAVATEIRALLEQWEAVLRKAASSSAPAFLLQGSGPLERLLRDMGDAPDKLITNCSDVPLPDGIPCDTHPEPFALWSVREQLRKALRRRVYLKSGGTLIIDPCEAMTVIDVNTSGHSAGQNKESSVLALNLEAADEIARLLRLRRAGGIVLVDFIDMHEEKSRETLLARLEAALREDRVKTVVHGFTSLGLVELTRKKSEEPLRAETLRACPACGGTGFALSVEEGSVLS